ncbi:D3,D2-enoyl-CoA isomerase-like protein [Thermochaetoides thermophila DSM 1495]|uniref:D3,D2-enoyl-CoA isomerase-like protein n=1 Tax=Chaetomium thermophilum (strain DSM 1495 / CBS 144.50 / IMI 039719) TaxID=759272 RepID=G0S606_CHATD|nr:D3,D2-enoyl-CoA isomerase-like protein [Thermochaetoides thermophila DSM 1495]EGS20722.1 D3,D2-enoyl-CoA isomerase-like protein [Thermochaetoides thermophila DSM 1495]
MSDPAIKIEYRGRLAIVTINNEKKLNALNGNQYYALAQALREVATHDEVYITLLIGKGRYFSAGADVSLSQPSPEEQRIRSENPHRFWLQSFVANNLNITHAFYTHPKILVVGLNGPVIGLSAALVAFADFIYATPQTFLLTPFSSLGLVTEGGACRALIQRLGPARANEALIMSKRITAEELERAGFVNKIFSEVGKGEDEKFKQLVLNEINERLGEHLVGDSLLGIKKLIRRPETQILDAANVAEVFAGLDRFVSGVPQGEFEKIATGKKRHKL